MAQIKGADAKTVAMLQQKLSSMVVEETLPVVAESDGTQPGN